ncbi:MAG: alpha/beta hydrolase [Granulosicoccus sp.]|nr:alpha/beta hydrolase [Granulosicoccus sp.]
MQDPQQALVANDITLSYIREGTGQPLIFIHGAMGDLRAWQPQWSTFIQRFDCISYSRRYSYPNENPLNTREHSALVDAEDLLGLMDALQIDSACLVGSSYGGFTALATAIAAPSRVSALVSVEAPMMRYAYRSNSNAAIAEAFLDASARPARAAFEAGDDQLGVLTLTGGIVGKGIDEIPQDVLDRRMANAKAARSLALSDDEFPLLDERALAALEMPIMLVSGADTAPVHRAIFDEVAAVMPKAKIMIFENSGHSVSQQQPEEFNKAVMEFFCC